MHVAAITGASGSGKTTLIVEMIRTLVRRGLRVAAVKHTHHALNEERRGDTAKFEAAGASPVILAGDRDVVVFGPAAVEKRPFVDAGRLIAAVDADVVFVEGFKNLGLWPKVEIQESARPAAAEVLARLERIWTGKTS